MQNILMAVQFGITIIMGLYFFNALKGQRGNKTVVEKDNKFEMEKLRKLREIKLTTPLTEKTRPSKFVEVVGQESGLKSLKAALCGSNPQHVLIYGPPGVGKTAVARLVLEYAKKSLESPFNDKSKFIEIDATTLRFDDRGIADPLIGSVHDPIYQGAGALGMAGVPQPKAGAVTKAHGGILFIDEIGELHSVQMNKLLKVLEDRKVFLDSAYYSSNDPNIPIYIKDVFENGLPADFRLIGATTRSPEEIPPALRSRCVEVFFRGLNKEEIGTIALNCLEKISFKIKKNAVELVKLYCNNGRDTINLIQLCVGIAKMDDRDEIDSEDVEWVVENGNYAARIENSAIKTPMIGSVNGLAVYGANIGTVMGVEASVKKVKEGNGNHKITGIIEQEEIKTTGRTLKKKSNALSSCNNVITVLENVFELSCKDYNIHINFPGGGMVDGPSAGVSMVTAIYSALLKKPVDNNVAMTGEVSVLGDVRPIGGVLAKITAAKKAGIKKVIIPKENWSDSLKKITGIEIITVDKITEVIDIALMDKYEVSIKSNTSEKITREILTAK